jgi:dephospho-CoA kinase
MIGHGENRWTMERKKTIIGLTGTLVSGKATVAKILKEQGFHSVTLSDMIKDELIKKGIERTRKNYQDIGNQMRQEFGGHVLAQRAFEKYKSYDSPLIIDGIRNLDEINWLRQNSEFHLVGIDAPLEIRWERARSRNVDKDLLDYERFVRDDARDRGVGEPLNGQQVGMCLVQADFLIQNDEQFTGPIENSKLYRNVIEIYKKIMKK